MEQADPCLRTFLYRVLILGLSIYLDALSYRSSEALCKIHNSEINIHVQGLKNGLVGHRISLFSSAQQKIIYLDLDCWTDFMFTCPCNDCQRVTPDRRLISLALLIMTEERPGATLDNAQTHHDRSAQIIMRDWSNQG